MINKLHTVKNKTDPELLHNAIVRKRISLKGTEMHFVLQKFSAFPQPYFPAWKGYSQFPLTLLYDKDVVFFAWGDSFYHKHDVVGIFKRFTKEKVFVEVCIKKHNLQQYYQPLPSPVSKEHVIL
mgnify:CR=1 FL=1